MKAIHLMFVMTVHHTLKSMDMLIDDTTSSHQVKNLEEIIQNLRHDAEEILKFMASNGLVANKPSLN